MARVPPLDPEHMNTEQVRITQAIASGPRGGVRGPLAVWLHRPQLADKAQQLGHYCRYETSLPARLSELAILVTAKIWDSAYEWQAHEPHARKAGLSDAIINALAIGQTPQFTHVDESIVYRFSSDLNLNRKVSNDLYTEAEQILGCDALIDLVGVLGYYTLISMTINAFEVEPPSA